MMRWTIFAAALLGTLVHIGQPSATAKTATQVAQKPVGGTPSVDGAEAAARSALVRLRKGQAEDLSDTEIGRRHLSLMKAEANYRAAVSSALMGRLARAKANLGAGIALSAYGKAGRDREEADKTSGIRLARYLKHVPNFIERWTGLGESGVESAIKARIETNLRLVRIRESAAHEVLSSISPARSEAP